jgi:hypothetical protein
MILSQYVEMILTNRTHSKLTKKYKLNKDLKVGEIAKIPISILSKSSNYKIDITCDYCDKKLKVPYKRYNTNTKVISKYACSSKECSNQKIKDVCQVKYGVDNPFQVDFVKEKSKETLIEKYGVKHPMFMQETKNKIKETCLERYGVDSYTKTDECKEKKVKTYIEKYGTNHESKTKSGQAKRKETRIKNGNQIPDELLDEFYIYRRLVDNKLDLIREEFIKNWSGYDYYDGEYIRDNLNLKSSNRLYPSIDHKTSVYYGFLNNIDIDTISSIDNLCVTKSYINSKKRELNESDFIEKYKLKKKDQ